MSERAFKVRIKETCCACPFIGDCDQCNNAGWYYTHQIVNESDIEEVTDVE